VGEFNVRNQMKIIFTIIISVLFCLNCFSGEKPSFIKLNDAIQFISGTLGNNNYDKLKESCVGKEGKSAGCPKYTFENLKKINEKNPILKTYEKIEFPEDKDNFKIGGHMKELGCIHIDFVKIQGKWFIQDLWTCR
jgi:hypothetical protein